MVHTTSCLCSRDRGARSRGLSTREVIELVRKIMFSLPVKVVDLVEVAPVLDYRDITSWVAVKVIYDIFTTLAATKQ